MSKFTTDFEKFTTMVVDGVPFAYARYADGEVSLMKCRAVDQFSQANVVDNWSYDCSPTVLGDLLRESMTHNEIDYYYAISAKSDSVEDNSYLKMRLRAKESNITFANLWINANYQSMLRFYKETLPKLNRDIYLICNESAFDNLGNYCGNELPFKVKEYFPFPSRCVEYFEYYGTEYVRSMQQYIRDLEDAPLSTFLFAAGPVSEVLIDKLYRTNPNHQYIDIGSSLDEYTRRKKTRPYMDPNSQYAKEISEGL